MACRLFGAKPLSEPMLTYCKSGPRNIFLQNFYLKFIILFEIHKFSLKENAFEKCGLQNVGHFVLDSLKQKSWSHIELNSVPNIKILDGFQVALRVTLLLQGTSLCTEQSDLSFELNMWLSQHQKSNLQPQLQNEDLVAPMQILVAPGGGPMKLWRPAIHIWISCIQSGIQRVNGYV